MATAAPRRRLPAPNSPNPPRRAAGNPPSSEGKNISFRKESTVSEVSVVSDWRAPSRSKTGGADGATGWRRSSVLDWAAQGASRFSAPMVDHVFRPLGLVKPKGAPDATPMITMSEMHKRGLITVGIWLFGLLILSGLADGEKTDAVFSAHPRLFVLYASTAAAFAFAVGLDLLALYGAVTHEKRILSGLMAYVDVIACLSYLVLATVPLVFARDTAQGNPVWLMRTLEWVTTCPNILFWVGLVTRAPSETLLKMMAADALLVTGGALSSCMWAVPQVILFTICVALYGFVLKCVWEICGHAAAEGASPAPALPARACNLLRWEICISWSIFPLVEMLRRTGMIGFEGGEALNCIADYAAKVGLAMIMVNCNLEQANALKVREMENVLGGMLSQFKKGATPEMKAATKGMGKEVSGWLMTQFGGGSDERTDADEAERAKKRKLNRALAKVDPDLVAASDLFSWDFDALGRSEEELVAIVLRIFDELKVISAFGLSRTRLRAWVLSVRAHYHENPFHNWRHAVTVLHTAYLLLTELILDAATDLEVLTLLLAALSHDLDHDGVNNAYHCNAGSELALTYNDQSVLENHHCHVGFQLLKKSNLLEPLEAEDQRLMRKIFVQAILGTDMVHHSGKMAEIKKINEMGGLGDLKEKDAERLLVLTLILHTADLYNPIKPYSTAYKWAALLQKEFNAQVRCKEGGGESFEDKLGRGGELECLIQGALTRKRVG